MNDRTMILICTHGNLATSIIESAEMIVGQLRDVVPVCLQPGMSGDEYLKMLGKIIDDANGRNILVLADLFGGTPCITSARLIKDCPIHIITGLNLGMLLEVYLNRENKSIKELKKIALDALQMSCVDVNEKLGF